MSTKKTHTCHIPCEVKSTNTIDRKWDLKSPMATGDLRSLRKTESFTLLFWRVQWFLDFLGLRNSRPCENKCFKWSLLGLPGTQTLPLMGASQSSVQAMLEQLNLSSLQPSVSGQAHGVVSQRVHWHRNYINIISRGTRWGPPHQEVYSRGETQTFIYFPSGFWDLFQVIFFTDSTLNHHLGEYVLFLFFQAS